MVQTAGAPNSGTTAMGLLGTSLLAPVCASGQPPATALAPDLMELGPSVELWASCSHPCASVTNQYNLVPCKSRGGNGRLWKRCGLPSIMPRVSPLLAQDHGKGDEHLPQRRVVCVRNYTDHGNNLPLDPETLA